MVDSLDTLPVAPLEMPDPSQDGWESEALHQASNQQLKRLAKSFAKFKGRMEADQVRDIVDDGCTCSALRPDELEEVVL